ncbi:hypothetical protein BaRGS_00031821, partial [Batillaria attramentaria]
GFQNCLKDWEKQYGKTYGFYRNDRSSIVTSDLELVKDVMVKNFQAFPNRRRILVLNYKPYSETLLLLRDDHWKFVRSRLSPVFSSGKLKKMVPAIKRSCRNLVKHVAEKAASKEDVDLKILCQTYTMDVMAGTAFGIELDSLAYPDHPFVKMTEKIQNPPKWMSSLIQAVNYMLHVVNTALKIRRQDPERYPDVLQLLVDTEREQETEKQVDPEIDHMKQLRTSASWTRRTGLTDGEMQANLFDFLMAGYDTSATVMYFFLYNLAAHPECVEKVQEEIDRKLGENEVDYWVSTDLPYLDMCMNESLRLYPPACMLDRECSQDTVLGGMHVPKNMLVTLAIYNIHTDPEHWPDPMKFDPERHTPEARASRHPFSFLPFGMGPRNCIGMRKAQMDLKMGVAAILQKFTPVLCDKSVYPPKIANHFKLAAEDMWVKFEPRKQ